jgi:branched-chain amino acid transport system ATP-binding protein
VLRLENVTVSYGMAPVLHDVSIDVREGEIVALVGANGAGKTTLLRSISRLLACQAGTISFDGKALNDRSAPQTVRLGISQVPEGRRVFGEMTVEENLEMGAYSRHKKANLSSELKEIFAMFPILLERRWQLADTLSGGEQQMLALGRALMSKPRLLLLDEPSMGLAPLIVAQIFRIIQEIRGRGTTVLLVEQNATMALRTSDRAYVLSTGRIVKSGASSDLAADPSIAEAYLGGSK